MIKIVIRQYLLSVVISALTLVVFGVLRMPADCGECIPLLIVSVGLALVVLAVVNAPYFLFLAGFLSEKVKYYISPFLTIFPAILFLIAVIVMYYDPGRTYENTDLKFWLCPAIADILLGIVMLFFVTRELKKTK